MTTPLNTIRPDAETLEQFSAELDTIYDEAKAKVGQKDANYIRKTIRVQRGLEIAGRISLVLGFFNMWWWVFGVIALAVSKILDNMEIGHNVLHGQYDWMNDPHINSRNFEWDIMGDSGSWKRYHNHDHHTYTNILGKDRDFGYGVLRLSDDIPWAPRNRYQMFIYFIFSSLFQYGIAFNELAGERIFFGKPKKDSSLPISREQLKTDFFDKLKKSAFKDYLFFPLIAGPAFFYVFFGNMLANLIRNWWASTIIFCGHFTEEVHVFDPKECENETRGEWYFRQILGSSNFKGSRLFHIMSGYLSCQVEHHLYPDLPAPRYYDVAPKVQAVCEKYGIPYNNGSFLKQFGTVLKRFHEYSKPPQGGTPAVS